MKINEWKEKEKATLDEQEKQLEDFEREMEVKEKEVNSLIEKGTATEEVLQNYVALLINLLETKNLFKQRKMMVDNYIRFEEEREAMEG